MKKAVNTKLIVQSASLTLHSDGPSLSTFHSFSIQLLQYADFFTELSDRFEKQHEGNELTYTITLEYRASITAAIFSAWSFVDATINEFFWTARKNSDAIRNLGPALISALKTVSKDDPRKTLEKYQKALELTHKGLFCRGGSPYQQAYILSRLRNQLIHFEPEWVGKNVQEIEKDLRGKFRLSPFSRRSNLFFPDQCLSHGCAEWAMKSALHFVDEFWARIGIEPKYEPVRSGLSITKSKNRA